MTVPGEHDRFDRSRPDAHRDLSTTVERKCLGSQLSRN